VEHNDKTCIASKDRAKEATELLATVQQSAPHAIIEFESLAAVLPSLPFYAKQWCISLIRRTSCDPARAVAVLEPMLRDVDPGVRRAAASVLGYCGDESAVLSLQAIARNRFEPGRVRIAAMRSIGRLLGR
jgi:HEAT repeat protein